MFLTGKRGAGGGVEAVAAVGAVAAGDVIVRVFDRGEWRAVVHLFISSFEAERRPFLHGNSVSEGAEAEKVNAGASYTFDLNHRFLVETLEALMLLKGL